MDRPERNVSHVLRLLSGFAALSAVMGLLLAGVALPVVGTAGSSVANGVGAYNALPAEFDATPLAQGSKITDASGHTIANPYDENRVIVPLAKIAPIMQQAQIDIEDSRFYDHGGLDLRGFIRAGVSTLSGKQVQGASTLTQQYVKMTLQENALRADDKEKAKSILFDRTVEQKLQELKYASTVEKSMTKKQILEGYLNLVNYGDNSYGVEAAARNYFGVSASKLTYLQAALLAGIVQSPDNFNPVTNPKDSQARRDLVLDRMAGLGHISAKQLADGKKTSVKSMLHRKEHQGTCLRSSEPYFCDYVLAWLKTSPAMSVLGKTAKERERTINQGGLTIKTTLNSKIQQHTRMLLTGATPIGNKQNLGSAATIIEPGTGRIIAMAQASSYAKQQVNWNVERKYGGGEYGYQFGSTAKTFALVTALERGMPVNATIFAPTASASKPHTFTYSDFHDKCKPARWDVHNDALQGGQMTLAHATASSVNTAFAALTIQLGACSVRDTMTRMGLHDAQGDPIDIAPSSIALGAGTTVPISIASAYATLAAGGTYCSPMPILSIKNAAGKELTFKKTSCKEAVKPDIAAGVTQLLKGPLTIGTATGAGWNQTRPAAGKTGTTENHNQSWFVGYTRQLSTAVWIGNVVPAYQGHLLSLNGKCFGDRGCKGQVFGGTVAAPVWGDIMRYASEGTSIKSFESPSDKVRNGNYVSLPGVIGYSVESARARLQAAGFSSYVAGEINSSIPRGLVAGTVPSGRALKNTAVGLLVSTGYVPKPPVTKKPTTKPSKPPKPPRSRG